MLYFQNLHLNHSTITILTTCYPSLTEPSKLKVCHFNECPILDEDIAEKRRKRQSPLGKGCRENRRLVEDEKVQARSSVRIR